MAAYRKRTAFLVSDWGGEYEDKWEEPVIAFASRREADRCAAVRYLRHSSDPDSEIWGYFGSEVRPVEFIDYDANRLQDVFCEGDSDE